MQEITRRRVAYGETASRSWKSAATSATAVVLRLIKPLPAHKDETKSQELMQPHRPTGMCEAQRIDFMAACEGKITWWQYFAKWGRQGLSL